MRSLICLLLNPYNHSNLPPYPARAFKTFLLPQSISSQETHFCCLKTPTRGSPTLFSYILDVDCKCLKDVMTFLVIFTKPEIKCLIKNILIFKWGIEHTLSQPFLSVVCSLVNCCCLFCYCYIKRTKGQNRRRLEEERWMDRDNNYTVNGVDSMHDLYLVIIVMSEVWHCENCPRFFCRLLSLCKSSSTERCMGYLLFNSLITYTIFRFCSMSSPAFLSLSPSVHPFGPSNSANKYIWEILLSSRVVSVTAADSYYLHYLIIMLSLLRLVLVAPKKKPSRTNILTGFERGQNQTLPERNQWMANWITLIGFRFHA